MHVFVLFIAWAVVSGATAWSSSEVSCGSCGLECQKACGTRNFRACCFNFQRRRRSQAPSSSHSLKGLEDPEAVDIHLVLKSPVTAVSRSHESQLPNIIRFISRLADDSFRSPVQLKDLQLYHPAIPSFLQSSSEDEEEEEVEEEVELEERDNGLTPRSQGVAEGRSLPFGEAGTGSGVEADTLNRLVEMAYRHPSSPSSSSSLLHRQIQQAHYPPSPSKIRK